MNIPDSLRGIYALNPSEARNKFETLKSKWQQETQMLSSITKKIKHPAYQEIIAMGEKVVPFILEELSR